MKQFKSFNFKEYLALFRQYFKTSLVFLLSVLVSQAYIAVQFYEIIITLTKRQLVYLFNKSKEYLTKLKSLFK